MKYEPVIGLEIHVQLATKTKMFCRCSADVFGKPPNSVTCPVCLGLPGALPVTNGEAVRLALLAGEALGSTHPKISKFDRKNYFYPDLPKGYQISQSDAPFNIGGEVLVDGAKIAITRAHLEEDAGKLIHEHELTLVDLNRSGLPLLEIVSEPVISSPSQARSYGQKVQLLMRYAGVSEADMEKGSLRMDANISMRPVGSKKLGTKVEVKNMNSFRSVEKALLFEITRQTKLLDEGERVVQETRGWDEAKLLTISQRLKEGSEDYRYFPEPDLPAIAIDTKLIKDLQRYLGERSPDEQRNKLINEYGLDDQAAGVLTSDFGLQEFYIATLTDAKQTFVKKGSTLPSDLARKVANWLTGEYLSHFNKLGLEWNETPVTPAYMAELIYLFDLGQITASTAKSIMAEMFDSGSTPSQIIKNHGYKLSSQGLNLAEIAKVVLAQNPQAVSDYHHGKEQVFGFLFGQIQKTTSGQADPTMTKQALQDALKKP